MKSDAIFYSETYGQLDFDSVVTKIEMFARNGELVSKVIVGSDSHPENHHGVRFVTAIAVVHPGHGGIYFWSPQYLNQPMAIEQRMVEEAWLSVEVAMKLREYFGHDNPQIEIHADVSDKPTTKSFASLEQVRGLIAGSGFSGKIKPDAYVASKVADRHT